MSSFSIATSSKNNPPRSRALSLLLVVFILASNFSFAAPAIIPRPPEIAATSYILLDAKTGQVLIEENADEALPPASLTKIMTAYVVTEEILSGNLALSDEVHISEKAWRMEGSKMFVGVDTQVEVEDLLRGIIIQSGNDASVAMAEHIAGSEECLCRHDESVRRSFGSIANIFHECQWPGHRALLQHDVRARSGDPGSGYDHSTC